MFILTFWIFGKVFFKEDIFKIKELFCNHRWTIKEWWPLDKDGEKLFEDIGLLNSCEKCGKMKILYPTIPKINNIKRRVKK